MITCAMITKYNCDAEIYDNFQSPVVSRLTFYRLSTGIHVRNLRFEVRLFFQYFV